MVVIDKKVWLSLFIVISFALSMAAYPLMQSSNSDNSQPDNPLLTNYSIGRQLDSNERIFILRTGRSLLENFYNSTDGEYSQALEDFGLQHRNNVFVVQAPVNGSADLKMVGTGGNIYPLHESNLTAENLFAMLCQYGVTRPLECTLAEM